jgi:hypothetical protein
MKRSGIHEHEPVAGLDRRHVDERLEECDARRELFEHPRPAERMEFRLRGARLAAPQPVRSLEQLGHARLAVSSSVKQQS